jgi:hypothetical protein
MPMLLQLVVDKVLTDVVICWVLVLLFRLFKLDLPRYLLVLLLYVIHVLNGVFRKGGCIED